MGGLGWAGSALVALALAGCGPSIKLLDDTAPDGGSEADDGFGTGDDGTGGIDPDPDPATTAAPNPSDTGATFGDESGVDSDTGDDVTFIDPVDTGCAAPPGYEAHCTWECDIWQQDCPRGEKCMPWSNDGGSAWNAVRCSPIAEDPAVVGESCTVEGSGVSGLDNCELGAMCFYVDSETNEGLCVGMCTGSPDEPVCDAGSQCLVSGEGTLALCLPTCNPLNDDCAEGLLCTPNAFGPNFGCITQVDFPVADGQPCDAPNECATGLVCLSGDVTGCDSVGCCAAFCNVSDGDPNPACVQEGQSCVSWYEKGQAPPGYEDVGVCIEDAP